MSTKKVLINFVGEVLKGHHGGNLNYNQIRNKILTKKNEKTTASGTARVSCFAKIRLSLVIKTERLRTDI